MKKLNTLIACLIISASTVSFATNDNAGASVTISSTASVANDLNGEWTIKSVRDKEISTRERAYLHFSLKDSTFYGNNGCNAMNGAIHSQGLNKVSFDNIITTMMECHNATSERTILKALSEVAAYQISKKNGIRYLSLMNNKGQQLMNLKNHDINFLNGAWTVSSLNGESIYNDNVRIVIDVQEMRIHGNTGCNLINGTLHIDPNVDWGVEFQQLVSTLRMCPDIHIETALLVALEETQTCKKLNNDEIALFDRDGKIIATLKRLNLR